MAFSCRHGDRKRPFRAAAVEDQLGPSERVRVGGYVFRPTIPGTDFVGHGTFDVRACLPGGTRELHGSDAFPRTLVDRKEVRRAITGLTRSKQQCGRRRHGGMATPTRIGENVGYALQQRMVADRLLLLLRRITGIRFFNVVLPRNRKGISRDWDCTGAPMRLPAWVAGSSPIARAKGMAPNFTYCCRQHKEVEYGYSTS